MGNKLKIGLDTYWSQFDGLLDKLKSFQFRIKHKLEQSLVEIIDAGIIDNCSKAGPSHYCAIGVGHISEKIHKLAELLEIEYLSVC